MVVLPFYCHYCGFEAKTPHEIWIHECDGKRAQREAIKMGQDLGTPVVLSV